MWLWLVIGFVGGMFLGPVLLAMFGKRSGQQDYCRMTFVITVILGAGIVLIASALDNSSIFDTVVKMTQNQPINWSGKAPASSANSNTASGAGSAGTFQMADPVVRGGAATVNRHIIISVVGIGAFGIVRSIVKNEGFSKPIIGAYILMVMLSLADILGGNVSMITGGIAYVALLTVILSSIDAFTLVGKMLNRKPPSSSGGGSGSTKR